MIMDVGYYVVQILKSVLTGSEAREKPSDITFEQIYGFSSFHCIEAMVFYGISKLKEKPEAALYEKWKKERDRNILKSLTQQTERDMIIQELTANGISTLPLKGCLLQEMYPQPDYRQMADLDILIDKKKCADARKILENMGYVCDNYQKGHHDNYSKLPFMEIEIHRELLPRTSGNYHYYENIWEKAVQDKDNPFLFHFSWTDYYIFMLLHFAKHYFNGGSGIRNIMDIHVFLSKHKKDLDEDYLLKELEGLGIEEFRRTAEKLASVWFAGESADEKTKEMACYVFSSGIYGTLKNSITNSVNEKSKVRYILQRTFLPFEIMASIHPILRKIPILLPFFWVTRLVKAVFTKRKSIMQEIKIMSQIKK